MTESEWLASTDPQAMLAWLTGDYSPVARDLGPARVSGRKLRLVACAIFRASVGGTTWSAWSSTAIESAEKFADGTMTFRELQALHAEIPDNLIGEFLLRQNAQDAAESILRHHLPGPHADASGEADAWQLADIHRDIVGNPFRPVVLHGPKCETCHGRGKIRNYKQFPPDPRYRLADSLAVPLMNPPTVIVEEDCPGCGGTRHQPCPWITPLFVSLAQGAYDNRLPSGQLDPEILAVLSDALEDAGCAGERCSKCQGRGTYIVQTGKSRVADDNGLSSAVTFAECRGCRHCGGDDARKGTGKIPHPLLAHLRSPGPHWRGCWAVDLLLGKE